MEKKAGKRVPTRALAAHLPHERSLHERSLHERSLYGRSLYGLALHELSLHVPTARVAPEPTQQLYFPEPTVAGVAGTQRAEMRKKSPTAKSPKATAK
jgi:hypothetical protein